MTLIECIRGETTTDVAGESYHFTRDAYGRYVARVHRHEHAACLLAVEHYREAPDVPQDAPVTMMTADTAALLQVLEQAQAQAAKAAAQAPGLGAPGNGQAEPPVPGAPVMVRVDPNAAWDVPNDLAIDDFAIDDSGEEDFSDDFDDNAGVSKEPDSAQTEPQPRRRGRPRKTAEA
ncbi:MAG: hypothetical protein ACK4HD_14035 [Pannonibacter phragmitetus]